MHNNLPFVTSESLSSTRFLKFVQLSLGVSVAIFPLNLLRHFFAEGQDPENLQIVKQV